ncbi:MAG: YifB family Mg chelatase-like AAA ATPase, partial [Lentisphaerota bacterium]
MLAKTFSAAVIGIDAYMVEVEVNATGSGEQDLVSIVGLPDTAIKESRDRVRSALHSTGFPHPHGSTLVNLAPADLKKEGAAFDLAIALGMLAATGYIDRAKLAKTAIIGELALDGSVRAVRGALPVAVKVSAEPGLEALLTPHYNAEEAALAAGGFPVYPVGSLREAVDYFKGGLLPYKADLQSYIRADNGRDPDFAEVKGQAMARRALEIAAAGGHNSLMIGPPGTGKSMIAARLAGILPHMTLEETLETSRIHSVLGLLSSGQPLLNRRPFRSPHHTISDIGLIGGGKNPSPGEISMAHNGVLFLDELPEFKRNVLEVLRQPLESGMVNVARAAGSFTFPAKFMLVAAMNPCPCGRLNPVIGCRCKPNEVRKYRGKISGPLLDRIDLHVEVPHLSQEELLAAPSGEPSAKILERVKAARAVQSERFSGFGFYCNAHMTSKDLPHYCRIGTGAQMMLRHAITNFHLSPRAYDRILKVARTIADLAQAPDIDEAHLFEAINY